MPTVFNAANELAVKKFLQRKIGFLDIYDIIGQSMERHTLVREPDLDQILEIEKTRQVSEGTYKVVVTGTVTNSEGKKEEVKTTSTEMTYSKK